MTKKLYACLRISHCPSRSPGLSKAVHASNLPLYTELYISPMSVGSSHVHGSIARPGGGGGRTSSSKIHRMIVLHLSRNAVMCSIRPRLVRSDRGLRLCRISLNCPLDIFRTLQLCLHSPTMSIVARFVRGRRSSLDDGRQTCREFVFLIDQVDKFGLPVRGPYVATHALAL